MALSDIVTLSALALAVIVLLCVLRLLAKPVEDTASWWYNEHSTVRMHRDTGELQHLFEGRWVSYGDGNLGDA